MDVYQNSFSHRDVSIGNALAFETPQKREVFKLHTEFTASLGEVTTEMLHEKLVKLGKTASVDIVRIPDAKASVIELEALLAKLGIDPDIMCQAFVTDCDMAKDWRNLFNEWKKEKSSSQRERSVSSTRYNPLQLQIMHL